MNNRHAARLTLACVIVCLLAATAAAAPAARAAHPRTGAMAHASQDSSQTFNLTDFGAVGDGQTDDGPALQAALNAVVAAGGGTLLVPAGRFAIVTPVVVIVPADESRPAVEIRGVGPGNPIAAPTAGGDALSQGLGLVSEFAPKTGEQQVAILLRNFRSLLVQDVTFIGTPNVSTDAKVTLAIGDIDDALIRHCEFYGLISQVAGGSIIQSMRTHLTIRETAFLGCTANSGLYTPVVQNWEWKGITVEDSIFIDYGQRPELYAKTGYGAPLCWVNVGHPLPATPDSPRREVVLRRVFLDEGGWQATVAQPTRYTTNPAPIDLFYVTGLYVNVSNFNTTGHYISGVQRVLLEDSLYTWSHRADSAIYVLDAQDVILDRVRTEEAATRFVIEYLTSRLTVIDSTYTELSSAAGQTLVLTPATPDDDDPVRYVRAQFASVLGREPDAAAHYYWSRKILDCAADASCVTTQRTALAAYLATNPVATFAFTGRASDENGQPLAGVKVTLSGSQTVEMTTGADGTYSFGRLPTSGVYTLTASKRHYTFAQPTRTVVTPAGEQVIDFGATLNRYAIGGRLLDERGRAIQGATLTLSGTQTATTTSDANGNYSFNGLGGGGTYTVNASSTRYSFANPSQTFTDLDANKTADFGGTSLFYSITGQAVDTANKPMTGLSLTLSGGKTGTTTTDLQGNFAFVDLPRGGSYTITTSKLLGYLFTPTSKSFDNLTTDQTSVFVGVPTSYKLAGRVTSGGSGLAGVTMTLSGSKLATATTDANGAYSFDVPVYGDYAVAPTKTHYTFDRANATFTSVTADRTADFVATLNRHRISGTVKRPTGAAMAGVTVTLSGAQAATTTTDSQGGYSFANLPAGAAYTVTPSKLGYDLAPASKSFTDLGADQTADFSVTPSNVTLAGRATTNGEALAGVTITLSGSKSGTTTTDAQGNYSFTITSEGSYTVTAAKTHYTFVPPSQTVNNPTSAQTVNFDATLKRYKITGRVLDKNNVGLSGVTVALTGSLTVNAVTDAQGNYSLTNLLASGNYTIVPSKANYTFSPASVPVSDLGSDLTLNFNGTLNNYTLAGRVTSGGSGLAGVTVTLSGSQAGTVLTDGAGAYTFTVPAEGSYTVTPALKHYTFAPASATFANLGGSKTADFAATLNRHTVSGRITDKNSVGIQGATVTLSGSQSGTATTDAQGNYSFTNLPAGGSYTLTATRVNYTLSPASVAVSDLSSDSTANNFTGTLLDYTLSGRVTFGGMALAGVTITLSGSKSGTATTDGQGNYSFTVPAEGDYTITPALAYHIFAPASQSFNDLSGDARTTFAASILSYRISGRVTEKGAALAGVAVDLTGTHPVFGAQTGQATTGPDGAYSFTVPAGGDYTVKPSKKNYTFDRAAATFKGLASDQAADFAATLQTVVSFAATSYTVAEGGGSVTITVTREGDTTTEASVVYEGHGDTAKLGSDFVASIGLVTFAPGETSKTFTLFITDDAFAEGPELFTLTLTPFDGAVAGSASVASVTINDNDATTSPVNPLEDDEFFVRQHYRDFFSREPDAPGLRFWTDEIKRCGTDARCREARRVSVSAAFFLSIEFKETGYFVYRLYRATYGRAPVRVGEFMLDSRVVGDGVVVGAEGWAELLAANKKAFLEEWTHRPEFEERFAVLDDLSFLQALFTNMQVTPTDARREALLAKLRAGTTRAAVLAEVIDDEQFNKQELNRAFVLMQYFGYLRRNPNDLPDSDLTGYNFWLGKLNEFSGDYEKAEMVKAFLSSTEYRSRFGN